MRLYSIKNCTDNKIKYRVKDEWCGVVNPIWEMKSTFEWKIKNGRQLLFHDVEHWLAANFSFPFTIRLSNYDVPFIEHKYFWTFVVFHVASSFILVFSRFFGISILVSIEDIQFFILSKIPNCRYRWPDRRDIPV